MKKRVLTGLAALLLLGMLSACAGGAGGQSQPQQPAQSPSSAAESGETDEEAYPEDLDFLYTEQDFGYSIRLLDSYHGYAGYGYESMEPVDGKIQEVFSEVIYVTQYSGDVGNEEQKERIDMSQYHDSTDIFDLLLPNMQAELFPGENIVDYSVEEKGTKILNGVEMTKFEGTLKTVDNVLDNINNEYPFVAYGIAGKKTPVLVCCVDRTHDKSRHAYWVDKIEDVVSTYKDAE